jgi:glycosyltransferase involved in cell wall biosynthesis
MEFQKEVLRDKFKHNHCCVIIPTYNNATTLGNVIEGVLPYTDDIIVVNDGSTDNTSGILAQYKNLHVITQPENRGKGFALRTAFASAWTLGFQYAITIDSDGQHDPADLPKFIDKL